MQRNWSKVLKELENLLHNTARAESALNNQHINEIKTKVAERIEMLKNCDKVTASTLMEAFNEEMTDSFRKIPLKNPSELLSAFMEKLKEAKEYDDIAYEKAQAKRG